MDEQLEAVVAHWCKHAV